MGHSRRILYYPEKIALYDLTHMMSMTDLVVISVETLKIYSRFSLEKEFNELICINS